MKTLTELKRTSNRTTREDGDATKARILEAAGRLFAEKGYAATTSKEICEAAGTNITGVNYHFGSRDDLYRTVIHEVQNFLMRSMPLEAIRDAPVDPRQKLELFLDSLSAGDLDYGTWQVRLWSREMVAPTDIWMEVSQELFRPKLEIIMEIVSAATGIPVDHPLLTFCFLHIMSPFMVLMITGNSDQCPHKRVFECDAQVVSSNFKDFLFAGLDRLAEKYRQSLD